MKVWICDYSFCSRLYQCPKTSKYGMIVSARKLTLDHVGVTVFISFTPIVLFKAV